MSKALSQHNFFYATFLAFLRLIRQARCELQVPDGIIGWNLFIFTSLSSFTRLLVCWLVSPFLTLNICLMTFLGDGNKSSPLNTNWTSPKQLTNDKRKPLDDSYAGVSWPFLHFRIYYRRSDECPAEWLEEESARKMKSMPTLINFRPLS